MTAIGTERKDPPVNAESKSSLAGEEQLFAKKTLPTREVEIPEQVDEKGKPLVVLLSALRPLELDEINDVQNRPIKDDKGNIVEEANRIGWDAKVVARALRKPDRSPMFGIHWLAGAEKIGNQMLPGVVKRLREVVLDLSGFGEVAREEQKKDSSPTPGGSTSSPSR